MKAIVFLNSAAGNQNTAAGPTNRDTVANALQAAGIEAEICVVPNDQLNAAVEAAIISDVNVVIAGGGDGTINTVANVLAGTDMPLGILALGTLNHFAKDLGIPLDIADAARVIAARHIIAVDVARVNDRVFINNSSLGVYPRTVLERETNRKRGLSKWVAMGFAMLKVFRRFPMVTVRLRSDEHTIVRKTPLVFVGNNTYQLDALKVGTRACLDGGELSLYVANTQSRWGMLKLTFRAIFGRLKPSRDFETFCLSSFTVETRRRRIHVALDGEVMKLNPPLKYSIWPNALRVCAPTTGSNRV